MHKDIMHYQKYNFLKIFKGYFIPEFDIFLIDEYHV